ncbi:hypothetical protein ACKWTF_016521 [Chironomus riparius]
MDGESSAKRSRIDANHLNNSDIIDITDSSELTENVESFVKIAKDYVNDDSFFASNPSIIKICQAFVQKKFYALQKKNGKLETISPFSANKFQEHKDNEFKNCFQSHQIVALKEFYSSEENICGLNSNECSSKDKLVAADLIEKDKEFYIFYHEIIRDYFVADYILNRFKNHHFEKNCEKCVSAFIYILINKEFENIRKFINEGLKENQADVSQQSSEGENDKEINNLSVEELEEGIIDDKNIEKLKDKNLEIFANKLLKETENSDVFIRIFIENLEHLIKFIIEVLQHADNDNLRRFLLKNTTKVFEMSKDSEIVQTFMTFILKVLNNEDLKILVKKRKIFQALPKYNQCSFIAETLTSNFEEKFGKSFVREALLIGDRYSSTILTIVTSSHNFTPKKFEIIFDILEKYLTEEDIKKMMTSNAQNILHALVWQQNEVILKVVWNRIKEHFKSKNAVAKFRELIFQKASIHRNRTVLHVAAVCVGYEFQMILWQLLNETFASSTDLKELVMQNDRDNNNFVHTLVTFNEEQVIELVFKLLDEKLKTSHFREVFQSKGFKQRNVIQKAADKTDKVSVHQCLWKNLQKKFSNAEFKHMLTETDTDEQNILHITASFLPGKIFDFMIQEIVKIMSCDEIRELLSSENKWMENIFQSAVKLNFSQSLHESLWKTYHNYFKAEEIVDFITHPQIHNCNLMHVTVGYAPRAINEFTWNEIKKLMSYEEQREYLSTTGFKGMTLDTNCRQKNRKPKVLSWIEGILGEYELM